jgi:hypothetical protein
MNPILLQDCLLTTAVSDLNFGLSEEVLQLNKQILKALTVLPYVDEKVDEVLQLIKDLKGNIKLMPIANFLNDVEVFANENEYNIVSNDVARIRQDYLISAMSSMQAHLHALTAAEKTSHADTESSFRSTEAMLIHLFGSSSSSSSSSSATLSPLDDNNHDLCSNIRIIIDSLPRSLSATSSSSLVSRSLSDARRHFLINPNEFTIHEEIGRGAYGAVYIGVYRGQKVAIKQLLFSVKNTKVNTFPLFLVSIFNCKCD